MKTLVLFLCGFLAVFTSNAQVPTPRTTNGSSSSSGLTWTKVNDYDYVLRENGRELTNVKDLKYLSTDTLAVLDKTTRNVYLLNDFKNAYSGANGSASLLERNVGSDFYLTNPYSFVLFTNDEYLSGPFVNIGGNYVYYVEERGATYFLKDIRKFSNWGAKTAQKLDYSPNQVYWCSVDDGSGYHVVVKGASIDYSNAKTEKRGNDLVVKMNGVDTYLLPGFYTMASYVFKPAQLMNGNSSVVDNSNSSGCVDGDCNNGWGKYQYDNGYYDGFWKNGKKEGYGLYKWDGIGKYIGSWKNDNMNGYGVYMAENDDNIVGEYQNGQLNGLGYTVTGENWEQGVFSNGNLSTHHDFYTNNVDTGCTAGDCQNKYGRYKWSNGDSFTGFFKNGKMYMGTYTFSNGDKYSGMCNSSNQFDGMGRFFFVDGAYYGGEWSNGTYHGRGYFHNKDYEQQIGEWSNGSLIKSLR